MGFHLSPIARIGAIFVVGIGLSVMPSPPTKAAEKGQVTVEKVEYKGWKNNLRLSNGEAELILTLDVGPRVISYKLTDGKNVFVELADQLGKSGETEWVARGGHRLWPDRAACRRRRRSLRHTFGGARIDGGGKLGGRYLRRSIFDRLPVAASDAG